MKGEFSILNYKQLERLVPHFLLLDRNLKIIHSADAVRLLFGLKENQLFQDIFQLVKPYFEKCSSNIFEVLSSQKIVISSIYDTDRKYDIQVEHLSEIGNFLLVFYDLFHVNDLKESNLTPSQLIRNERESLSYWQEIVKEKNINEALREKFISNITHDLKTPLATVQSSLYLIQKRQDRFSKDLSLITKDYFDSSFFEIFKVTVLLKNVSFIATNITIEKLKKEHIDVVIFIKEILEKNFPSYCRKNLFNITITGKEERVCLDKSLFSQVIINMVINFLEYNEKKRKINLSIQYSKKNLLLVVRGERSMPAESLVKRISEIIQNKINEILPSTEELGIAVAKMIIIYHGGTFEIDNYRVGEAAFKMSIPLNDL